MPKKTVQSRPARAIGFGGWLKVNRLRVYSLWLGFAALLCAVRTWASPLASVHHPVFLFVALGLPVLAFEIVLRNVPPGRLLAQPAFRLARIGQWNQLDPLERHDLDRGKGDIVLSMLLGGLLLNLPVRALEFAAAMPFPIVDAPDWYLLLYPMMLADLVLLSSCYAALVALAIGRAPLFPRLLVAAWLLDIGVQLAIGGAAALTPGMPDNVAVLLADLLKGNIQKVAISMVFWLPYLALSGTINGSFRGRMPCPKRVVRSGLPG